MRETWKLWLVKKTARITVKVTPEDKKRFGRLAAKLEVTESWLGWQYLKQGMAENRAARRKKKTK